LNYFVLNKILHWFLFIYSFISMFERDW